MFGQLGKSLVLKKRYVYHETAFAVAFAFGASGDSAALTLPPSTWCAAVAVPHTKPFVKKKSRWGKLTNVPTA